jgi:hypothetical protein
LYIIPAKKTENLLPLKQLELQMTEIKVFSKQHGSQ